MTGVAPQVQPKPQRPSRAERIAKLRGLLGECKGLLRVISTVLSEHVSGDYSDACDATIAKIEREEATL